MLTQKITCLTPLHKQCFVTLGVALNIAQLGLAMGIAATMVPQLKEPTSSFTIDDEYGSWIASIPSITYIIGNIIVPYTMAKYGRKTANLCSLAIATFSWTGVVFSSNVTVLLIARSFQGIGMGMISFLAPVLVGEYVSPKNRGALLMVLTAILGIGILTIHTLGLYFNWTTVALICVAITLVDAVIVLFSPESPSWLAFKGKHEECKRVFRWLRGDDEEEELIKMLDANKIFVKPNDAEDKTFKRGMIDLITYLRVTFKKKEFYKPIIIMCHIYTMSNWSGINIFSSYALDLTKLVIGEDVNFVAMIVSFDAQRVISSSLAIVIIKNMKRRTMLKITAVLNFFAMVLTGLYVYAKTRNLLPFDSIYIGISLMHFHICTIAIGTLPMVFVLGGEIFPLRYKSLAGGISALAFSINTFLAIKTVPFSINHIGLDGTFFLYSGILLYCFLVVVYLLPETKDRTLQDIEDEMKNNNKIEKSFYMQTLESP